jgi:carboxypeptidase Taq
LNDRFDELLRRLGAIDDLVRAGTLLGWDEETKMPPAGAEARAEQRATVEAAAHERRVDPALGELLEELRPFEEAHAPDSFEASVVRVARRDYEKAVRVPSALQAEIERAGSLGYRGWLRARAENDISVMLPHFERNLELRREYVECFAPEGDPYDIVLDDYEPGMKTSEVEAIFDRLKERLVPLIQAVVESEAVDDSCLHGTFSHESQRRVSMAILESWGMTEDAWRLDDTVHPFEVSLANNDIRLTTRFDDDNVHGILSCLHEFGHGLYEHQVEPSYARTSLADGVSSAIHESQSRMWENLVGRSQPFWRRFFPRAQELFGAALADHDAESWYREVNAVEPSLIRVEADEATYNMHIILRFELEQAMLADEFPLEQLPEEWNRRIWEYLGIEVPNDTLGVLQDVHWSGGSIGYFPTYALGNLISAQIWERITAELPDLSDAIEAGDFAPLRDWLRENLHRHGRKFTPGETLERVVGTSQIDPEPYVRYLREKLAGIYGIAA